MHTIYIDVLLILNLYVNGLLLKGTARLTHSQLSGVRCLLAAAAGSLTSLLILLPPMPTLLTLLSKLLTAMIPVGAAWGLRRQRIFWRNLAVFLCISFAFAGLMLALCTLSDTNLMIWSGSCIYLHFSLTALILCTALAYFLLRLISFFRMRLHHTDDSYEILVRVGTHMAVQKGLPDTGNSLTDCFTGCPVIIFGTEALKTIPEMAHPETLPRFRMLPYATLSSDGMLPVFRPDEVIIRNLSSGHSCCADVLIGFVSHQTSAIFNPNLLRVL
ncbi:MAG: sigma-E processing peptidase SpoIIGA [Ruminococcus sp.]|nr:sigma-E processing peptidase SpoIIGA [Ruminococcus sp.]